MTDAPVSREYRSGSDPRTLRDALGCFATGVTVVTCLDQADQPIGLTANSFTSLSLDPPLLLVCVAKAAASAAPLSEAQHFAVNVLQTQQQPASITFSTRVEDRSAARPGRWASTASRCSRIRCRCSNAHAMRSMTVETISSWSAR